jgi:hypothetical protein
MITSRRDYILRIIDEVARLLSRVVFKRRAGADQEALESVVQACERLFGMEADKLFQFTPEQHFLMLTDGEPAQIARDKVLLYAALNAEAGRVYTKLGRTPMARATFTTALQIALKARAMYPQDGLPEFAPDIGDLVNALGGPGSLDAETAELLQATDRPSV